MLTEPEKPWYLASVQALFCLDIPQSLSIPERLFARDYDTLVRRTAREGESFLTKTLPSVGKVFDLALQGRTCFQVHGFKRAKNSSLPAFLQGLTKRVFDPTGRLVDEPCIEAIRLLRQIFFMFKKIRKGFTDDQIAAASTEFKEIDGSLPDCDHNYSDRDQVLACARALVQRIFTNFVGLAEMIPKHGPGAVALYRTSAEKRNLGTSYHCLERVFRPIPWFRSLRDVAENLDEILGRTKKPYGISRMAFVEKDSGGPRVIGLEPAEYMWTQQAVKTAMVDHIERRSSMTRGHVNFTDQEVNRSLASQWSIYETLDMSKASDRCSYALVRHLFSGLPLWRYLDACRTPGTELPSGEILYYKKFAPMGSAVCFPVESIVFFSLTVAALHVLGGMPLLLALKRVFVYGDDLIVPRGFYPMLRDALTKYSLKFNEQKCCIDGKFRESCGADRYDGYDVTPIRLKTVYPINGDASNPLLYVSLVGLINNMTRLYPEFAKSLRQFALEAYPRLREMRLPVLRTDQLPGLYWYDPVDGHCPRLRKKIGGMAVFTTWTGVPVKEHLPSSSEQRCLRESLCRRGRVGLFGPRQRLRQLDKRYDITLKIKPFKVEYRRY